MVEMGPISFYLGLKLKRDRERETIKLFQPAYVDKVLEKFNLNKANAVATSMKGTAPLTPRTEGEALKRYEGMTGWLVFSMVEKRPDITYVTSVVNRFAKIPSHQHTEAVKTILRYLKVSRE